MGENLRATTYNDGTPIPLVEDATAWLYLNSAGYCWYNNDEATYKNTYGALYNWYVVGTGKLCPTGWHVPSDAEWTTLVDFAGGSDYAGGKLKEKGTTHWTVPNTDASDEYGFKALPGGDRYPGSGSEFWGIGEYCAMWSSTEYSTTNAYYREIYKDGGQLYREYTNKRFGFSVRCIKN
jgi:uncharacterized protein (TIGR02145 family)